MAKWEKDEDYIGYKRKRATVRKLSRESNREIWEQFVKRLEYDATVAQRCSFKVFRNLRNEITDKEKIDVIPEEEWKNYFKEMLINEEETYQPDTICVNEYNAVKMTDLENTLRMSKNGKAPGIDEINMELIKYASIKLKKDSCNYSTI
jgi:hypothetical protein